MASGAQPQVLIIHALGGQGKSQIVLEYCGQSRELYDGIFWVNATSEALAMQSYAQIATALSGTSLADVSDGDKVLEVVKHHLESWNTTWLLVFDNYDRTNEFTDIQKFLPKSKFGHIIFTSRNRDLGRLGSLIELPAMSVDEGNRLLLRGHSDEEIEQHVIMASSITERLGGLALALDQAAAYIQYKHMSLNQLGEFLNTYDVQRQKIMSYTPKTFWEYGTMQIHGEEARNKAISAFTTWEMSLEQLQHDDDFEKDQIIHFLTTSAFFNPARIEEFLVRNYWEGGKRWAQWLRCLSMPNDEDIEGSECVDEDDREDYGSEEDNIMGHQGTSADSRNLPEDNLDRKWDSDLYWDMLQRSYELSLLQSVGRDAEEAIFSLHPLIRDWLQLRRKGKTRQEHIDESLDIVVTSAKVYEIDSTSLMQRQALLTHVDTFLVSNERLSKSQYRVGHELEYCTMIKSLALFYYQHGRYAASESLWRSITETRAKLLGGEHPDTLVSMHLLAVSIIDTNAEEAERILRRNLDLREKVLGKEHRDTLQSMGQLARALYCQGRHLEAEPIYRQTLVLSEKILGEEDLTTLATKNNLAVFLESQARYEESEQIFRQVLVSKEILYGKEHSITMVSRVNLATSLSKKDKLDEAQSTHRQILAFQEKVLGKEHPTTLSCVNSLAVILHRDRSYEEAEQMFQLLLPIQERLLGKKHLDTLSTLDYLALCLRDQGKCREAEKIWRRVLDVRQELLGKEHPNTLGTLHELAVTLHQGGNKLEEAERIYRQVLPSYERVHAKEHPDTQRASRNLRRCLKRQGKHEEAEQIWQQYKSTST